MSGPGESRSGDRGQFPSGPGRGATGSSGQGSSAPASSDHGATEPSATPRVSAVVLTLDEERHLPDCLRSLGWADELLVLDSGSVDRTVEIARAAGARVERHPFENYSRQRQRALELAAAPWVLFVDADERVPEALAREVRHAVALARADVDGWWIPRRNVFWGHRLRGGGWWPDHQLRLLRVAAARYDPDRAVHEVAEVRGATGRLATPLVHLNYDSLAEFRAKQRAYAAMEARRREAAGDLPRARHLLTRPAREAWRRYVGLGGWRDGVLGVVLCALMGWYEARALWAVRRLRAAASRPSPRR